jgi:hypothetical protein
MQVWGQFELPDHGLLLFNISPCLCCFLCHAAVVSAIPVRQGGGLGELQCTSLCSLQFLLQSLLYAPISITHGRHDGSLPAVYAVTASVYDFGICKIREFLTRSWSCELRSPVKSWSVVARRAESVGFDLLS